MVNREAVGWRRHPRQRWKDPTVAERKRTKAEERAYAELHDTLLELERVRLDMTIAFERLKFDNMPAEWASVEGRAPVRRRKVRIHAAYDEDVAKFFRVDGARLPGADERGAARLHARRSSSRQIGSRKNEDWMGRRSEAVCSDWRQGSDHLPGSRSEHEERTAATARVACASPDPLWTRCRGRRAERSPTTRWRPAGRRSGDARPANGHGARSARARGRCGCGSRDGGPVFEDGARRSR